MTMARIAAALIGIAALSTAAEAADLVTYRSQNDLALTRGYSGALPSCADEGVQRQIAGAFSAREREYWGSSLTLSPFVHPVELGYRSWGASFVPRRFCAAGVATNDGKLRHVYWNVGEQLGFALSTGLEWCVTGLDRNHAYSPDCKMARP